MNNWQYEVRKENFHFPSDLKAYAKVIRTMLHEPQTYYFEIYFSPAYVETCFGQTMLMKAQLEGDPILDGIALDVVVEPKRSNELVWLASTITEAQLASLKLAWFL